MLNRFLNKILIIIFSLLVVGCASIPKETVTLSEHIGADLVELEKSHIQLVDIHYNDLKNEVNSFINDVYAPFIIHYVLKDELQIYKEGGKESIYYSLMRASDSSSDQSTVKALEDMSDFVVGAREQIEEMRNELLQPITEEESQLKADIEQTYSNTKYANSVLTAHLRSLRKLKETQNESLAVIGLGGLNDRISNNLSTASTQISELTSKARSIDLKADSAIEQINEISRKIKETFNKN